VRRARGFPDGAHSATTILGTGLQKLFNLAHLTFVGGSLLTVRLLAILQQFT
jgi:hypothetical protein